MDQPQPKPKGVDLRGIYRIFIRSYFRHLREEQVAKQPPVETIEQPEGERKDVSAIKAAIIASHQLMKIEQATWTLFLDQLTPSLRSILAGLTDDSQRQQEALSAIRLSITTTVAQIVKMKPADAGE